MSARRTAADPAAPEGRATVQLKAEAAAVLELETFLDSLSFLENGECNRLKLAGDEILDNLIRHAAPLRDNRIVVHASKRADGLSLGFFFHSAAFATFATACNDLEPLFEPLFDAERRRWRCLGLRMCGNLCNDIYMRPGELVDRIFLRFALDPAPQALPDSVAGKALAAK